MHQSQAHHGEKHHQRHAPQIGGYFGAQLIRPFNGHFLDGVAPLLERHEQVDIKRQIGDAQALKNFLQRFATDKLGRALSISDAQPEEQLDNGVSGNINGNTVGVVQIADNPGSDGHFVIFAPEYGGTAEGFGAANHFFETLLDGTPEISKFK